MTIKIFNLLRLPLLMLLTAIPLSLVGDLTRSVEQINAARQAPKQLEEILPIVRCCFEPTKYEKVLMTKLRDVACTTKEFREYSKKIADILVSKVVECLPTRPVDIQTPVAPYQGIAFSNTVELVSVMRSGDILLDTFLEHFPDAHVSKFLIQRDEHTALPHFIYMKASPTLTDHHPVIITEPMVATGGTLEMVINMLKEKGVLEQNIIIACVCAAPEGLLFLNEKFPAIQVVMTSLDQKLNSKKYIVPGLGDFGDRFFGTPNS
jgi:uracil phosphoribosyltransferase